MLSRSRQSPAARVGGSEIGDSAEPPKNRNNPNAAAQTAAAKKIKEGNGRETAAAPSTGSGSGEELACPVVLCAERGPGAAWAAGGFAAALCAAGERAAA